MSSMDSPAWAAADCAVTALESAVSQLADLTVVGLQIDAGIDLVTRLEVAARRLEAAQLTTAATVAGASRRDLGGRTAREVLADRLHLSPSAAGRRINQGQFLCERQSVTGERLEPVWPNTAQALAAGEINTEHVEVIRRFFDHLPEHVTWPERAEAEKTLAAHAVDLRPDELQKVAIHLAAYLNPDGTFSDRDRANKRGITVGRQGPDLMSRISGYVTPELRAMLDALFAKLARSGINNLDTSNPVVDGEPTDEQTRSDWRNIDQRRHDALLTMCREMLASESLGQQRGVPTALVVTTTLDDLTKAANGDHSARPAHTGGGTYLPMRDVIKLASNAHHYLAIFDGHSNRPLYLGRAKRLASADQRIMLHAHDRGCSFPGCDKPGYWAQTHHRTSWAHDGQTDITDLTFACEKHHQLAEQGWRTVRSSKYRTAWIPPKHIDPQQKPRINRVHHPHERLSLGGEDEASGTRKAG